MQFIKTNFKLIIAIFLALFLFSNINLSVQAAPTISKVSGWAWNSNIGYLHMAGDTYSVNVDKSTPQGKISGWAWSSIVGWVCWGQTCTTIDPVQYGSHTAPDGKAAWAEMGLSGANRGKVDGWVKIIALKDNGWVHLRGVTTDGSKYGVNFDFEANEFNGWAWHGGGKALGWFAFSGKTLYNTRADMWAWSPVIGWIALRGTHPIAGGGSSPYEVTVNTTTGNVNGWAWNDNAGWICWGDTCNGLDPSYGTVTPVGGWVASYNTTDNKLHGWAKILSLGDRGWIQLDAVDSIGICTTDPVPAACESLIYYPVDPVSGSKSFKGYAYNGNSDGTGIGWIWFGPRVGCTVCSGTAICTDPVSGSAVSCWAASLTSPWVETKQGDIYSQKDISATFSPPAGSYNATYLIQANGTIAQWTSECPGGSCGAPVQTPKSSFGDLKFPAQSGYKHTLGLINVKALTDTTVADIATGKNKYGYVVQSISGIDDVRVIATSGLGNKVYYRNGDMTINNDITFFNGSLGRSGAGTIVVKGDLIIEATASTANINYNSADVINSQMSQLASVGWIVIKRDDGTGGNIIIRDNKQCTSNLVGVFYAEGNVSTGTGDKDICGATDAIPLKVEGAMMASSFSFDRIYTGATGAEQINYSGRMTVNTPPGFEDVTRSLPTWREVAPQ